MNNPVDYTAHITQTALTHFLQGHLNHEELTAAAEHIAQCEQCARALANAIEAGSAAAPIGFDEEVIKRVSSSKRERRELTRFAIRVALAACVALFFIFSSAWGAFARLQGPLSNIKAPDFTVVESINHRLQNFSLQILKMEVF